jgi:hypothetical protein
MRVALPASASEKIDLFTHLNQRQKEIREQKVSKVIHANLHLNAVFRAPQWNRLEVMQIMLT